MSIQKTLDIIIVTYNCSRYIGNCLDSLYENSNGVNFRVYIVDNNSRDDTLAVARVRSDRWKNIEVIKNDQNLGFAKANNLAILQSHAPYVLLLNPDTIMKPGTLSHLVVILDEGRADIVGPQLLNEDGSVQRWGGGFFPSLGRVFRHYFFLAELFKNGSWSRGIYINSADHTPMRVDWISGAFLLFRRDVVKEIGLLREDFFMYGEDMEFCYRARKINFRIMYDPTVSIVHLYGKCSSENVSEVDFQSLANMSTFFKETHGRWQGCMLDLMTFLGFGVRAVIYIFLCGIGKKEFEDKKRRSRKLSRVAWRILTKGSKT